MNKFERCQKHQDSPWALPTSGKLPNYPLCFARAGGRRFRLSQNGGGVTNQGLKNETNKRISPVKGGGERTRVSSDQAEEFGTRP